MSVIIWMFFFNRKKFGWITFIVNLSLYLAFLLPFTALAVYLKINICELCGYQFCNNTVAIPVIQSVSDTAVIDWLMVYDLLKKNLRNF